MRTTRDIVTRVTTISIYGLNAEVIYRTMLNNHATILNINRMVSLLFTRSVKLRTKTTAAATIIIRVLSIVFSIMNYTNTILHTNFFNQVSFAKTTNTDIGTSPIDYWSSCRTCNQTSCIPNPSTISIFLLIFKRAI